MTHKYTNRKVPLAPAKIRHAVNGYITRDHDGNTWRVWRRGKVINGALPSREWVGTCNEHTITGVRVEEVLTRIDVGTDPNAAPNAAYVARNLFLDRWFDLNNLVWVVSLRNFDGEQRGPAAYVTTREEAFELCYRHFDDIITELRNAH